MALKQTYNYYKNLKLGVAKAERFLKDLENKLEPLSSNVKSEFSFNNVFSEKILFFEESKNKIIDEILASQMLEYLIYYNDMVYLNEYTPGLNSLKVITKNYFNYEIITADLKLILESKTKDLSQQQSILYFFIVKELIRNDFNDVNYSVFVSNISKNLYNFCNNSFNLKSYTTLVENFLEYLFKYPGIDSFFYIQNKNFCSNFKGENLDHFDLELPKLLGGFNIDLIDFSKFFLAPLNLCRIKLNLQYLSKIYNLDFKLLKKMCLRYKLDQEYKIITRYACDFLGKDFLKNFKLDQDYSGSSFEIYLLIDAIFAKRIILHERIFRNIVMGSFSRISINNEKFFSTKDKWVSKIK
jgi:hypothetical protein